MTVKVPFFLAQLRKRFHKVDHVLYFGSALFIFFFGFFSLLKIEQAQLLFDIIKLNYSRSFGWLLVFLSVVYLIVSIGLVLHPAGKIRLGGPSAVPDYSYVKWLLMVLCAGMNIGFIVWSVGEPVSHLLHPPSALSSIGYSLLLTSIHWGFYHWVLYSLVGISLAYAVHNRGLPLRISSALEPVLGNASRSWFGRSVDLFMVVVAFFCMTETVGLLIRLIMGQLSYIQGYEESYSSLILILTIPTALLIWSVFQKTSGGMLKLSRLTMVVVLFFLGSVFLLGPTSWLVEVITSNFIVYLEEAIYPQYLGSLMSYQSGWTSGWTVLYMLMWLSWAPVTGVFIAKISKGRTIRECVIGVVVIPTVLTLIWFGVFGATGIHDTLYGDGQIAVGVNEQIKLGMFALLEQLPGAAFWQVLCTGLVIMLCVTSNDAGIRAVSVVVSGEGLDSEPLLRVSIAVAVNVMALVLILVNGLNIIMSAAVFSGAVFALILFLMSVSFVKSLLEDFRRGSLVFQSCQNC